MILVAIACMPTSNERTTEFPAHFALLKWKHKMSTLGKKISADKSKQTSTFLEIQD